jgi:hypothetical protein
MSRVGQVRSGMIGRPRLGGAEVHCVEALDRSGFPQVQGSISRLVLRGPSRGSYVSKELDKAGEQVAAGQYKKALKSLWDAERGARADVAEARGLLELASAIRDKTTGRMNAESIKLIEYAEKYIGQDLARLKAALDAFKQCADALMLAEAQYRFAPLLEFQRYGGKVERKSLKRIDESFNVLADSVVRFRGAFESVCALVVAQGLSWEAVYALSDSFLSAETEYAGYIAARTYEDVMAIADSRRSH